MDSVPLNSSVCCSSFAAACQHCSRPSMSRPLHCGEDHSLSLSRTDWGTSIQPTRLRICTTRPMKLMDMFGVLLPPCYKGPCQTLRGTMEKKSRHKHKASHPPSRRMNNQKSCCEKNDEEARTGKREPHNSLQRCRHVSLERK
jgi:hypothetical protein